jgi:23S rRNA (cytosine1962-C5)-methyltransferase
LEEMSAADASTGDYELLDFGAGRKLERFGDVVLDRPCPAAEGAAKAAPALWRTAMARFDRTQGDEGVWTCADKLPSTWEISISLEERSSRDPMGRRLAPATRWVAADVDAPSIELHFHLQASPFGHVGVFPEQLQSWQWIARQIGKSAKPQAAGGRPLRILNLFGYTGGSTLAAAAAGAEVVHIDSARNIVERARRNAVLSGLGDWPIRWITEDVMKFCQREIKRGNRYDAVVLDPPSYGHGPKGEPWKIGEHLLPLITLCGELTANSRRFVLVTCHTPGIGPPELAAYLSEGLFGHCGQPPAAGELFLQTRDGHRLPSGAFARWPR